jgi:RNA polymerase II subunit A-like phosphatase
MEANGIADDDQQLLWTADILRRIHQAYYDTLSDTPQPAQRTVPEIVRDLRQQLLKNTRLVLSSLVPLHRQQASHLPRPPFVRHAENLGATLRSAVTSHTTHVVAAKDGTNKILTARRVPGCHIVKPTWLMECVWTLTRRDVRPHLWPAGKMSLHNSAANVVAASPVASFDESDTFPGTSAAATATSNDVSDARQTATIESNTTKEGPYQIEKAQIDGEKDHPDDDDDSDDDDDLVAELESQLMREGE